MAEHREGEGVAGLPEQPEVFTFDALTAGHFERWTACIQVGQRMVKAEDFDQLKAALDAERAAKEAVERTIRSVQAMLGWDANQYLPRETLERDIAALKSRAAQVSALQAQIDALPKSAPHDAESTAEETCTCLPDGWGPCFICEHRMRLHALENGAESQAQLDALPPAVENLLRRQHEAAVGASPLFSPEHWKHNAGPEWPHEPDDDSYIAFENCQHPACRFARREAPQPPVDRQGDGE